MLTHASHRPLFWLLAFSLLLAPGAGCGGDDDDRGDDGSDDTGDGDDGGEDGGDGGGDPTEFFEAPTFATSSPSCPPDEGQALTVLAGGAATGPRQSASARARSRFVFARAPRAGARDAVRPGPGAPAAQAGQFYLDRTYPRDLAAPAQLALVHDRGGAVIVKYRQQVGGIQVFRKELSLVLARDRSLVAVSGELTASAPADSGAAAVADRAEFDGGARSAIATAAGDLGVQLAPGQLVRALERPPFTEFRAPRGTPIATARARRIYFDDGGQLLPSFHVELMGRFRGGTGPELRSAVVGPGGEILYRNDKTVRAEPFSYRAYADPESLEPSISPFCDQGVPHPTGTPDGFVPTEPCAQELVSLVHAAIPSADPWLPDDATETNGNNVDAFFHIQFGPDLEFLPPDFAPERDFRAQTTGPRAFDYPYDVALAPGDYFEDPFTDPDQPPPDPNDPQLNAKITQAFYLGNYLHDLLYRHGYDEASGNSQADNYGRGGLGGDPLLVHSGSDTTVTFPTADGTPPVLTMGLNRGSQLRRDGTLDFMVFTHEWMHTMQHRLIGDSEGLNTIQAGSLAEGWSDFLGLFVAIRPEQLAAPANENWQGAFGLAPYFNQAYCDAFPPPIGVECTDVDEVYYFGIRRYPFTVDKSKSPLTFRYISNGVELPAGIPQRFWRARIENAEVHSAGEIWASALWGSYRALLLDPRYTFAEAQSRMLDYLVASMKATPLDPTFLEARDALLAVVRATDEEDYRSFRRAFAERGMGAGAVAPPRDSGDLQGAFESMREEGPALSFISAKVDDRTSGDGDGLLDQGEEGVLTVRLRNSGFDELSDTTIRVAPFGDHSDVTGGDGDEVISSAPGEDILVELPVSLLEASHYQIVQFDITFGDAAAEVAPATVRAGFRVHYDVAQTESVDLVDTEIAQTDWFHERDFPNFETVWTRTATGDGPAAYQIEGTRLDRGSSLVSPCVLASSTENLVVRFQHQVQLEVLGSVDVRTAGSSEFDWLPAYTFAGGSNEVEPVEVDLGQQYAGQWLQVRFRGFVPPAAGTDIPTWTVDDIEIVGTENTPFSAIYEQGEAPAPP